MSSRSTKEVKEEEESDYHLDLGSIIVHPIFINVIEISIAHAPYREDQLALHVSLLQFKLPLLFQLLKLLNLNVTSIITVFYTHHLFFYLTEFDFSSFAPQVDLHLPPIKLDIFESDLVVWQHLSTEVITKCQTVLRVLENAKRMGCRNSTLIDAILEQTQLIFGQAFISSSPFFNLLRHCSIFFVIFQMYRFTLDEETEELEPFSPLPFLNAHLDRHLEQERGT